MNRNKMISLFIFFFFCHAAFAEVPFESCFSHAAAYQNLPKELLIAVAQQESGFNPNAINRNQNKTYDIGVMQINSSWLPKLAEYGIRESDLYNPCVNIHVGAWIMAQNITAHGWTWKGIGSYNAAKNEQRQIEYTKKVLGRWKQIVQTKDQILAKNP